MCLDKCRLIVARGLDLKYVYALKIMTFLRKQKCAESL